MLVLAVEQGSQAPGAIERTRLDYAYAGHGVRWRFAASSGVVISAPLAAQRLAARAKPVSAGALDRLDQPGDRPWAKCRGAH